MFSVFPTGVLPPCNSHRDFFNTGIYAHPPVWKEVPMPLSSKITTLGSNSIHLVSIALLSVSTGCAFLARPCWSKAHRQLEENVAFPVLLGCHHWITSFSLKILLPKQQLLSFSFHIGNLLLSPVILSSKSEIQNLALKPSAPGVPPRIPHPFPLQSC